MNKEKLIQEIKEELKEHSISGVEWQTKHFNCGWTIKELMKEIPHWKYYTGYDYIYHKE